MCKIHLGCPDGIGWLKNNIYAKNEKLFLISALKKINFLSSSLIVRFHTLNIKE